MLFLYFFFFQAEDGIRDADVTGVQTCALPICPRTGTARLCPCARKGVFQQPPPLARPDARGDLVGGREGELEPRVGLTRPSHCGVQVVRLLSELISRPYSVS